MCFQITGNVSKKMKKKIIVSSSDSKYFELLKELHESLINNDILEEYDFGILDTGLLSKEIEYFKDHGSIVKKAEWNVQVPSYKIRNRDHLKTQVARAFLPDYFNNYKVYIWLDADTWVNDKDTFLLFEKGAIKNKLCITPQIDRAYGKLATADWFLGIPSKIRTINYKNISKSVSYALGRKYSLHATLNAGAFALNNSDKLWKIIQKNTFLAAKKGRIFGTDQVALALSVYEDNIPAEFLPAYTNWMCEFHLPHINHLENKFVEPYLPHHPIGLMHLAGLDEIRDNKKKLVNIIDLNGNINNLSIRFKKNRNND